MPLRFLGVITAAAAFLLLLAAPASTATPRPLLTAVTDDAVFNSPDAALGFARTRAAGASLVRLTVQWSVIAPDAPTKPAGFDASNPADSRYLFAGLDKEVKLAVANGLQPILDIHDPPLWAQDQSPHPGSVDGFPAGPYKPNPAEVGAFAHALAVRYGGSFQGLPRVRYWLLWNEPNLIGFLSPQFENGTPFSPSWYRQMLASFAQAIHGVHADNLVIAGALAPFHHGQAAIGPMTFIRLLLCMSNGPNPTPTCSNQTDLDALAIHPYTSGGPTHHANSAEDLSLGDLTQVRRVLDAAVRAHHVRSTGPPQLWVTEFSWDTRPPDPNPMAAPLKLQARWTAEALYRMWVAGVRVVTWFSLRDDPWPDSAFQAGLYFRSGIDLQHDLPKATLSAFKFPFVDFRRGSGRYVWGRTPGGRPGRVIVEQRLARKWKKLAVVRTNGVGIFSAVLRKRIVRPKAAKQPAVHGTYQAAVMADKPRTYWRLGDFGRKTVDIAEGHNGLGKGGVTFSSPGALPNDRDTAVCLNGTDGLIDLGPFASPNTVEVWVKTTTTADAPFFSNRNEFGDNEEVGTFLGLPHVFNTFGLLGEQPIADDHWHQVVYTYSGITGRIYVDGRLQGENTWIRKEGVSFAFLGYDPGLRSHFKGCLDEVALWDRALSPGRILAHFLASGRKLAPDPDLGALRARLVGSKVTSLPFPLTPPPDRTVLPFGG